MGFAQLCGAEIRKGMPRAITGPQATGAVLSYNVTHQLPPLSIHFMCISRVPRSTKTL